MKRRHDRLLKNMAAFILLLLLLCVLRLLCGIGLCLYEVRSLPPLRTMEPVQVYLFGSSDDSVSAAVTLMDGGGRELAQVERSWNSESISIDFVTMTIGARSVSFPERIYGNSRRASHAGVYLKRYFLRDKRCLLFEDPKAVYHLASFALSPSARLFPSFVKVQTINLSDCEPFTVYTVAVTANGTVFLKAPYSSGNTIIR